MKYNPAFGVAIMIIASIFIGYYLTMTIILTANNTNNLNRTYQALLMGFWMGLIELLMVILLMSLWIPIYGLYLILLILGIIILSWLIYYQVGIDEKQFMLSMIPHHQMAIDMVNRVYSKTEEPRLLVIMDNIRSSQQQEIDEMYSILSEMK